MRPSEWSVQGLSVHHSRANWNDHLSVKANGDWILTFFDLGYSPLHSHFSGIIILAIVRDASDNTFGTISDWLDRLKHPKGNRLFTMGNKPDFSGVSLEGVANIDALSSTCSLPGYADSTMTGRSSDVMGIRQRRRDGCTECRRKKVKCDLRRPVCTRCTRYPRGCVYDLRVVSQAPSVGQKQAAVDNNKDRSTGLNRQSMAGRYQPSDNLSPWLSSTDSRFYMHIFSTETANRLFPAAPEIFLRRMISAALDTPHLLYALLAAACSHHSRLVRDTSPRSSTACLKFTNLAISHLNSALSNTEETLRAETITTAMVLCTNDVCNGNMHTWRTHLSGVLQLVNTFLATCSSYTDDPYVQCLVKWFTTMDIMAGLSAHRSSCIHDPTRGPLYQLPCTNAEDVDDICGYSLELVPILTRLSRLSSQVGSKAATGTELLQSIMWEAVILETEIDLLIGKTVSVTTSKNTGGFISELTHTHIAFVYTALLHLRRRVQMFPKDHIDVRRAVRSALEAVLRIPPSSSTNIIILWPIFSIGCESDILGERTIIQDRMANMERIGMGNFTRVRKLLETYWESDSYLPWSVYFSQLGLDLVLF